MELKDVTIADYKFLYDLLKQRDETINISHKEMPTMLQHVKFLCNKPYPFHKIIMESDLKAGVCYISDRNEIGIFIDKAYQRKGLGTKVLSEIIMLYPGQRLLSNINPLNTGSQHLFKRHGFELIQITYALEPHVDNNWGLHEDVHQPPS